MASLKFSGVYINNYSTLSSKLENAKSKHKVDDFYLGEKTTENAEIKMQRMVLDDLLDTSSSLVIGSDLSNQLGITNESLKYYNHSYIGLYNACSSFALELIIGSSLLSNSSIKKIFTVISSHNLNAERTFRYPIEYGSPKRDVQTFTATGAVSTMLSKEKSNIKIESATIGKVIDYGVKDVNNMGAVMAPSAADTLMEHLKDLKRDISYYDLVLTGDLGVLGSELFNIILAKNDITLKKHIDAGSILITDKEYTKQGASGPACLPLILFDKIVKNSKYKKILIIGTGALHNTTMINQKKSIPSISHAVSLEVNL